jgi:hypothetical protein
MLLVVKPPARPIRPDDETLALAAEVVGDILSSRALIDDDPFSVDIMSRPDAVEVTIHEPDRRQLRDLLMLLRDLDSPTDDVRLDNVYEIAERVGVRPAWRTAVEVARADFDARNDVAMWRIRDPDEPAVDPTLIDSTGPDSPIWIRPREAFELWAYGEVIHRNYAKELRWRRFPPHRRGMARVMAHEYARLLLRQAEFVARLIKDGLERTDPSAVTEIAQEADGLSLHVTRIPS